MVSFYESQPLGGKNWRGITYDYEMMIENLNGVSCMVCLSDFELAWLQANVTYMTWQSRWTNCPCTPAELATMGAELERKLMTCINIQPWQIQFNYDQVVGATLQTYDDEYALGGIPELNPNTPTDFYSGDDSDDRLSALCSASNIYVRSYAQNWVSVAQTALGLVFVVGLIASISLVGGIIAVALVGGLAFLTQTAVDAMQDEDALDNVACCMFQTLDQLAITQANFITCLDSCGFLVGSNEAIIRDIIASDLDQFDNWLSFINSLGDAYVLAQIGVTSCPCGTPWANSWLDGDGTPVLEGWVISTGTYQAGADEITEGVLSGSSNGVRVEYTFSVGEEGTLSELSLDYDVDTNSNRTTFIELKDDLGTQIFKEEIVLNGNQSGTLTWTGSESYLEGYSLRFQTARSTPASGHATMTKMTAEGFGINPF